MGRWTIKPPVLVGLLAVLFLVFLILVLPDVDLPDAAFHSGTAPVAVHASGNAAPSLVAVASFTLSSLFCSAAPRCLAGPVRCSHSAIDSLPILHRSLRC
jgi:hypothetical protein